jgi:hypothetical protein
MYHIVIWLSLFSDGFSETLPVYNPNLSFNNKQSCEKFLKDNYSNFSSDIEKQFKRQDQIKLQEIITMECMLFSGEKI